MKTKEDYINEFWNQIISDISYNYYDDFGEDYEEQIDEWAETFANRRMKEQEENNKELTKYKRAFEILKSLIDLENGFWREVEINGTLKMKYFYEIGNVYASFTKEEYELLEELIGNENTK